MPPDYSYFLDIVDDVFVEWSLVFNVAPHRKNQDHSRRHEMKENHDFNLGMMLFPFPLPLPSLRIDDMAICINIKLK